MDQKEQVLIQEIFDRKQGFWQYILPEILHLQRLEGKKTHLYYNDIHTERNLAGRPLS